MVIPNSVKVLGSSAFSYCTNMTDVKVGDGVTALENNVFCDCSSLTSVTLPEGLTSIGFLAFGGCSLTQINIPEHVTKIGINAFYGCSSLADIYVHSSTPAEIGEYTFWEKTYSKATLHVPSGNLQNYATAAHWNRFIHIVDDVEPSAILSPTATEEPQMIFDINGNRLPHLTPGINIIKYQNGKIRKRYVKQ